MTPRCPSFLSLCIVLRFLSLYYLFSKIPAIARDMPSPVSCHDKTSLTVHLHTRPPPTQATVFTCWQYHRLRRFLNRQRTNKLHARWMAVFSFIRIREWEGRLGCVHTFSLLAFRPKHHIIESWSFFFFFNLIYVKNENGCLCTSPWQWVVWWWWWSPLVVVVDWWWGWWPHGLQLQSWNGRGESVSSSSDKTEGIHGFMGVASHTLSTQFSTTYSIFKLMGSDPKPTASFEIMISKRSFKKLKTSFWQEN